MANTGFRALRFTGELEHDDLEARRYALHAGDLLRGADKYADLVELVGDLDCVFGFTPREPWPDGRNLTLDGFHACFAEARARGKRIGLLFGNERRGLENEHLVHCHYRVALPTHNDYVSMNLAQAVLVVLWELARRDQQLPPRLSEPDWADPEAKRHLLGNLRAFMDSMDFLDPQNPELLWGEFHQLFNSRDWTQRELNLLNGLFGKGRSRYLALTRKNTNGVEP